MAAQDGTTPLDEFIRDWQKKEAEHPAPAPHLDPKRIINESSDFLKEREPEMTEEEYALYEKSVTLLAGNPAFAVKLMETMVAGHQNSPAFEFILGNAYYMSGDLARARVHYESAVAAFPTFLRAWNDLGVMSYSSQNYPEAVRCFSQCIALGDHDPKTFGMLGYCLERVGNLVPAEVDYLQALAGDPGNADWIEGLLRIYVRGRQFGRAESLVKDLVRNEPKRAEFWKTYADILIGDGRKLDAIAVLEAANDAGYLSADDRRLLADLYAERRMVPEAVATYRQLRDGNLELGEQRLLTLARLLTYEHAYAQAADALGAAEAGVVPAYRPGCLRARAEWYAAQSEWPKARATWQDLLQLEPMNAVALLGLGRAEMAGGDEARAEMNFEEAVRIPDAAYDAHIELATLEIKHRQYQEAIPHLERALALRDSGDIRDLLSRMRTLAPAPSQ
jgi:tetratricopeptide (TPR) repeat protein